MANYNPIQGLPSRAPYDIMTEQAKIARKKKLIEALQLKGMQSHQPTVDAGKYKVPNFMDPFVSYMDRRDAANLEQEVGDQEKTASEQMQTQTQAGIQDLIQSMQGFTANRPDPKLQGMTQSLDMQDVPRQPEAVPPDPVGGIIRASASQIPGLQEMGRGLLTAMVKQKLDTGAEVEPKELVKLATHYTVPSILEAIRTKNLQLLKPKGEVKLSGDRAVDVGPWEQGTGPISPSQYFGPKFTQKGRDEATGVPVQVEQDSGKMSGATGVTTPVPQAKGAAQFHEQMLGDYAKSLTAGKQAANDALSRLPNLQGAFELVDKAVMGTPWSAIEVPVRQAAKAFGWSDDKVGRISSTQAFVAAVSQDALETLKALRPASNIDLEYANKLTGSSPVTDPRTAKILVSMAISHSMNALSSHETNLGRLPGIAKMTGMQDTDPIKSLYQVEFGGPGSAFHDPGKYGIDYEPGLKRFKSRLLSEGGEVKGEKPLGARTPEEIKALEEEYKKLGGKL